MGISKFMNNVFKKYCGLQAISSHTGVYVLFHEQDMVSQIYAGASVCMSYFMNSMFERRLCSLSPK